MEPSSLGSIFPSITLHDHSAVTFLNSAPPQVYVFEAIFMGRYQIVFADGIFVGRCHASLFGNKTLWVYR